MKGVVMKGVLEGIIRGCKGVIQKGSERVCCLSNSTSVFLCKDLSLRRGGVLEGSWYVKGGVCGVVIVKGVWVWGVIIVTGGMGQHDPTFADALVIALPAPAPAPALELAAPAPAL